MPGSMRDTTWTTVRAADALLPKERLELDGAELAYLDVGLADQPAVLWVHGFPRNAYLWRGCLGPLAGAGYRSIAPDLLGLGESAGPQSGDYSLRGQARLADALLNRLGVRDVRLVGEGIGAAVCLALAALRPGRVKGAVLLDPPEGSSFSRLEAAALLARCGYGDPILWLWRTARALGEAGLGGGRDSWPPALSRDLYLRPILAGPDSRARLLAFLASIRVSEMREIYRDFSARQPLLVLVCRRKMRGNGLAPVPPRSLTLALPDRADRILESAPAGFLRILLPYLEAVG